MFEPLTDIVMVRPDRLCMAKRGESDDLWVVVLVIDGPQNDSFQIVGPSGMRKGIAKKGGEC